MALQVNGGFIVVPLSQTVSAAFDARALEAKTVTVEGTFTATYQVQISCDMSDSPAAGSWTNAGTALTAAGNVFVQQPCAWVRLNCTAFTSNTGALTSRVVGMTSFA